MASETVEQVESPLPWQALLWFGILISLPYYKILYEMIREWFTSEDMGHGIFAPLIAGYLVWKNRGEIFSRPVKPNYWGLLLVAWGFFQAVLGTLGADFFIARTAFVFALIGLIVTLGGFYTLRKLAFPLFLLLFMIRIPQFVYSRITFPLQIFASQVAATALSLLGIPVLREGNVLELASQKLSVVEACSGIRSLLSLSFLSLVYAYFFDRKVWMRGVLLAAAIPIAVIANAGRITLTGILSEFKKEFAEGVYHSFEGWVIFMVAIIILLGVHQSFNFLYLRFSHAGKNELPS